ncbi:MAG: extracellular solute-binding protein [Gammaproteobacteria bacterium]|nr:extracellular solute-binding protein [Gammaproteobacteria bacterium]
MAGNCFAAPMSHKANFHETNGDSPLAGWPFLRPQWLGTLRQAKGFIGTLLLLAFAPLSADERPSPVTVEAWHTFGVDTLEERLFVKAVDRFMADNPGILVQVVRIPYLQNVRQFINAAQAGEAPDLIRLSASELGKVGHVSVEGFPLLEDLRPHLTPVQKAQYLPPALSAMSYGASLYALPASQSCMSLLYNRDLFDATGRPYPDGQWGTEDLLSAAAALTASDVAGLALPIKWSYWFIPFIAAAGGALFDADGDPALDSAGTANAMQWVLDLEREHRVTGATNSIEAMSTRFQTGRAAMVIDGPWNWDRYTESGVAFSQSLLPYDDSTGKRLAPLVDTLGWSVTKQSPVKPAAVKLALWLTSRAVQVDFALGTYGLPTLAALIDDPAISGHPVLGGFIEQASFGTSVPTTRATAMLFEQLDTALALTHDRTLTARDALKAADRELAKMLAW